MSTEKLSSGHPFAGLEVIARYTREQAIEDGILVDVTEWASRREIMGGFLPPEYNDALWEVPDAPVCFSRKLWDAVDIEEDCPECDEVGRVLVSVEPGIICPTCNGKKKVKAKGVWQDTRGRAHDVIYLGSLAAKGLLRRAMEQASERAAAADGLAGPPVIELPLTGYYKLLLSKDGRSNGRTVTLKIVLDGDGVWIGYPEES